MLPPLAVLSHTAAVHQPICDGGLHGILTGLTKSTALAPLKRDLGFLLRSLVFLLSLLTKSPEHSSTAALSHSCSFLYSPSLSVSASLAAPLSFSLSLSLSLSRFICLSIYLSLCLSRSVSVSLRCVGGIRASKSRPQILGLLSSIYKENQTKTPLKDPHIYRNSQKSLPISIYIYTYIYISIYIYTHICIPFN